MARTGFARSSSFAVGERRGGKAFVEGEEGCAIRREVRVVRRGMEAERRASRAVWRRWGRRVRDCDCQRFNARRKLGGERTVLTPVVLSSSGRLRTWRVICTRVRGIWRVRIMLPRVLWMSVSRCRSRGPLCLLDLPCFDRIGARDTHFLLP